MALKDKILNVACALVDQFGFELGTCVCIRYDNSDWTFILALGVIVAGGIIVSSYPKDPYAELLYLAQKVRPKFLFCHDKNLKWAKQIETDLGYPVVSVAMNQRAHDTDPQSPQPFEHFEQFLNYDHTKSRSLNRLPVASKDLTKQVALITMSSGTTGKPKAVPFTHWNCIADRMSYQPNPGVPASLACCASLDYISGRIIAFGAIQSDYTAVILNGFVPKTLLEAVERYKISIIYLGGASFYNLITYKDIDKYDISSLRVVFPMGAKITYLDELREFFRKHPHIVEVKQGLGASETSGVAINSFTPEEYLKDCCNCGKLLPGNKVKIVDPASGKLLGTNQQGIMHIHSDTVFPGYYDVKLIKSDTDRESMGDKNGNGTHHESSSPFMTGPTVFDEDGFYISGDIGYFNEKEELYFVGRHKEVLVCRGAKKVLPHELEEVVDKHPAVLKVCVLGVANQRVPSIQCPRAYVVPKPYCYSCPLDELRTDRLAARDDDDTHPETTDEDKLVHVGQHKLCLMTQERRRQLAEDLMEFVNDRIGWEKQMTGGIVLLDDIPTSRATGKMDKNYLRSLSLDQIEIYGDRSS